MFSLLNRGAAPAVIAAALAIAAAPGRSQEINTAPLRQKYVALTRGWAADAVLRPDERSAMERGRERDRTMMEGLDDPLGQAILRRGEPSFDALAAAYPGKVLDRSVLGSYSDPSDAAAERTDEFVIWWNGAISANLVRGPAPADPKRVITLAENTNILFRVGAAAEMFGRVGERYSRVAYEAGYLPIVHAAYVSEGVEYRETAFAATPASGRRGPDIAWVRFELKNVSRASRTAELHEDLILVDGSRATAANGQVLDSSGSLLMAYGGAGDGSFDESLQRLTHRVRLGPNETGAVWLAIPYLPDASRSVPAPAAAAFQQAYDTVRSAWVALLASGTSITVPEGRVNDMWRALVLQNFVLADGPRPTYGSGLVYNDSFFPFENGFGALAMARYGYSDAAESWLSYLIPASVERERAGWRYQNRRAIALHLLYQFYLLTGRAGYFEKHRDAFFRVAEEIVTDRRTTMTPEEPRPWHYGLLPKSRPAADAIASMRETYVVAHNITNAQGLQDFGEFLVRTGIDKARGERYLGEAAEFRESVLRAMNASIVRSPGKLPLVPLQTLYFRDSSNYGPEPYDNVALGRVEGTYEHYWADMQLRYDFFNPGDPIAAAIAAYGQRYGGYVLGVTRARPREGQPYGWINGNYNAGYYEHALVGGDIDRFLLGFYSRLAVAASRHLYVASEGAPLIFYNTRDGGFVSPEYSFPNSGANAETLWMLRSMLVREERDHNVPTGAIDLARATPRPWLEGGKRIDVRRAPTDFGPLSYAIQSRAERGLITAEIDPPERVPYRTIRVHLRHPRSLAIRSVRVNGKPHTDFDATRGYVSLQSGPAHFTVEASYR
jgi:hypothetical protein